MVIICQANGVLRRHRIGVGFTVLSGAPFSECSAVFIDEKNGAFFIFIAFKKNGIFINRVHGANQLDDGSCMSGGHFIGAQRPRGVCQSRFFHHTAAL
ncbi:hypothetical protein [Serratia entomophila]|uniref:hypothetical protein n=1 Tax=Serratia entomophila TaxID=42906 RepID=UPI0021BA6047|nr:hypothetical protein [Serratia entomophila]